MQKLLLLQFIPMKNTFPLFFGPFQDHSKETMSNASNQNQLLFFFLGWPYKICYIFLFMPKWHFLNIQQKFFGWKTCFFLLCTFSIIFSKFFQKKDTIFDKFWKCLKFLTYFEVDSVQPFSNDCYWIALNFLPLITQEKHNYQYTLCWINFRCLLKRVFLLFW